MAEGVVEVKLLFFAKSRELVGRKEAELSVERNISAVRLHQHIISAYPILQPIQDNVVLAYKDEYLPLNDTELQLNAGDEIAIIPPLSGG
ncbi:Molybdopterin synthase sulfur carrier subunit [Lamellibrachia satsuma]|nr:Molybdopterin synthase sulfur carrier subunit [Lamellibrachia satsuma]